MNNFISKLGLSPTKSTPPETTSEEPKRASRNSLLGKVFSFGGKSPRDRAGQSTFSSVLSTTHQLRAEAEVLSHALDLVQLAGDIEVGSTVTLDIDGKQADTLFGRCLFPFIEHAPTHHQNGGKELSISRPCCII